MLERHERLAQACLWALDDTHLAVARAIVGSASTNDAGTTTRHCDTIRGTYACHICAADFAAELRRISDALAKALEAFGERE